jgi:hypothetical protein
MRFITIDEQSKVPVLVWEERQGETPKVVSRHRSLDEVPDADGMDAWRYDVPLTTATETPLNPSRYQVVDAQGAPLWAGARIAFNVPCHYINTVSGKGTFTETDQYRGVRFVSDEPMNVYGRGGYIEGKRREQYSPVGEYQYSGQFKGMHVLSGKLGDPFEHGVTKTYVVLDQDPRDVCVPVPKATAAPGR